VNAGAEDGSSVAKAASGEITLVRRAAAREEAAKALPTSFLAMEREVVGRALVPGVLKAAEEPRERAAATRKGVGFMVVLYFVLDFEIL